MWRECTQLKNEFFFENFAAFLFSLRGTKRESANIVMTQLKDLSLKLQASFLVSNQCLRAARLTRSSDKRSKASVIDQKWVVYNSKCDQCDACCVGHTSGDLFLRVDGHESKILSVHKH